MSKPDIVEDLRRPYLDREYIMESWDAIREYLLDGKLGSYARDIFESILDKCDEEREEAAAEIDRLRDELQAAHRWADARAAVVNLSISATDYREMLNELSEAEDRLAGAIRKMKGEQP